MNKIVLYTDGACSGNPGPGGWGVLVSYNGKIQMLSGYCKEATNNKMELRAMQMGLNIALQLAKSSKSGIDEIVAYSDSAYLINGINNGWVFKWKEAGWLTKEGKPVKNRTEWECILQMVQECKRLQFKKVKGHNKNVYNNTVDLLAKEAIKQRSGINSLRDADLGR